MPRFKFSPGGCGCDASCPCGDFPCPAVLGVDLTITINSFPKQVRTLTFGTASGCPFWLWSGAGVSHSIACTASGWAVLMIQGGGTAAYFLSDLAASGQFTCSPFKITFDWAGVPVTITQ